MVKKKKTVKKEDNTPLSVNKLRPEYGAGKKAILDVYVTDEDSFTPYVSQYNGSTNEKNSQGNTNLITASGKPFTEQSKKYYKNKYYTKAWKNYCPTCKKSGKLTVDTNTETNSITCTCGETYDICTGGSNKNKYLLDTNGKSNTTKKVDTKIGDVKKSEKNNEQTNQNNDSDSDSDGFTLHQGEILETHSYYGLYSCEWSKDYEGMSGEGTINLPYYKDDLKYIYKGVRCLLHVFRFHNGKESEAIEEDSMLCFITDLKFTEQGTEITLSSFEKLLEMDGQLSFQNMLRSKILEEVIKTAGLEPVVDPTGMKDEVISWTSSSSKKKDDDSSNLDPSKKYNQCSDTYSMCCDSGKDGAQSSGHVVSNPESKTEYLKTIGKKGTNYAKYVSGCSNAKEVMKKLRKKMRYSLYSDNRDKCAEQSFKNITSPGINCADSARLVKCCMDVCGIPCLIIHGSAHYYNNVKFKGKWYTTDLCFASQMGKKGSTNTLNDGNGHGATLDA